MTTPTDKQSIWKKEITFKKKKEDGLRVPKGLEQAEKPDSVADLLRPLAEQTIDPDLLPPVSPPVAAPRPRPAPVPVEDLELDPSEVPPVSPDDPAAAAAAAAAVEPGLEGTVETEGVGGEPVGGAAAPGVAETDGVPLGPDGMPLGPGELPPPVELPVLEHEPRKKPSRRQRKKAERAAAKAEKEAGKQAEHGLEGEKKGKGKAAHTKLVGLKIGASQIAAAQVVNKNGPKVVRMARVPLERGIVVGGELREPDELVAALKTFFRKNKLPRTAVRLGISNNRIGVRTFEISGIDDPKQLANAIRFRAQEALPIPLDEAVLDYRILDDSLREDGVRVRRVLLVVAHRELVDRYVTACRKAGLKLVGIDLEAFALLRALSDPSQPTTADDAGMVCISIGHDRSTLAVSNGEVCEFARVLAWGGASLDIAIARSLDLTPSEADPIKRQLALGEDGEAAGLDERRAATARTAMATELQTFAREVVASLRFYQEQPDSLGIGEILVTGGTTECKGLAEELERLIGVSVRVADPLVRVKLPRKLRKTADSGRGSLAVAVGLGIED